MSVDGRPADVREVEATNRLDVAVSGRTRPLGALIAWGEDNLVVGAIGLIVGLIVIRSLTANGVAMLLVEQILALAVLGMSVDLLDGYGGLVSLGQGAFYGTSGYMAAMLIDKAGIQNFFVVSIIALAATTVIAGVVGVGVLRTSWIYFLLVTFAVGQLLTTLTTQYSFFQVTGVEGMTGVGFSSVLPGVTWSGTGIYWVVGVLAAFAFVVVSAFRRSTFAYRIRGTRDAPVRMNLLGYNVRSSQWLVFVLAGFVAGIAGLVTAYSQGIVIPSNFGIVVSAEALIVMMIGGQRRRMGALVGATVVVLVQHYSERAFPTSWQLVEGALFAVMAFLGSQGLAGRASSILQRAKAELKRGDGI